MCMRAEELVLNFDSWGVATDFCPPWISWERAKENEALLSGSGMIFAGWRGSVEMTRQRFCTTAEKLYNCNFISQLQKKCTTDISFHNCKILRRNNRKNEKLLFHFTTAKKLYNCKTNAQQQNKCTTVKQIYCNTCAEALMGYSTWEIIILLICYLAFRHPYRNPTKTFCLWSSFHSRRCQFSFPPCRFH
jgi:hypothetical protein